jgi:dihydrofolate reductase
MRKLVVNEWITLDGVVQAPISASEDPEGGFAHAGWHLPYAGDPAAQKWTLDAITRAGAYLFGRRTYENFAAFWPHAPESERAVSEPLNTRPKHVVSTTLSEPLAWQHAALLTGDVAREVEALKAQPGGDLLLMGSPRLAQLLLAHDLVDEIRLTIDPVIVGSGKRLFGDDGRMQGFRLADQQKTGTGAILTHYTRPAMQGG